MPAIRGKPVLSRRKRVSLKCVICGSRYVQHEYRAKTSKYCSKECWNKRAHRECKACGKVFGSNGHWGKIYCSRKCSAIGVSGENHPQWKDGKSLERNRGRQSRALAKWKKEVKNRDKKCVNCGCEKHLHAHHIKGYSEFPELAVDIKNGITLCEFCHSKEHGRWIGPISRRKRWEEYTGRKAELLNE